MISWLYNITQIPKKSVCLLLLAGVFYQCEQKPFYEKDISGIRIEPVVINRYEEVLFTINPFMLRQEIEPFKETFDFFLGGNIDDPLAQQQLYEYLTDPQIRELYLDTHAKYPDLAGQEAGLTRAFRYYRAHFPQADLPRVFSYVSGLDFQMPVKYAENNIIIGLDMYLGPGYGAYRKAGMPQYKALRTDPAFMVADVMRMMGEMQLQKVVTEPRTFLDFMIYEGKMLYFLDCMLPLMHDSLKIGYTGAQLEWVEKNRGQVWSYFLDNEFLYAADRQVINKFIGDGPFTAAFSRGSAPRTAAWIGWQIVRDYMRRHKETSLAGLFENNDTQNILHESRFRGR